MRQVRLLTGSPGDTEKITSSASATSLPDSVLYKDGDLSNKLAQNLAKEVLITLEDNPIRYAFNADPTQDGGTGLGHVLATDDAILLTSWAEIRDFKYITKAGTSHSVLQVTPNY